MTRASGITSIEKWMAAKTPVKLGGVAPGGTPDANARILRAALGLPIQLVSGYKGTAEIRLAASSGELAGACWSWESMRSTWRSGLDTGEVVAVLQTSPRAFPDLPGVPRPHPRKIRRGPPAHQGRHPERRRVRASDPATAEELDRMVAEAFALEPALVAKLKDILYK